MAAQRIFSVDIERQETINLLVVAATSEEAEAAVRRDFEDNEHAYSFNDLPSTTICAWELKPQPKPGDPVLHDVEHVAYNGKLYELDDPEYLAVVEQTPPDTVTLPLFSEEKHG